MLHGSCAVLWRMFKPRALVHLGKTAAHTERDAHLASTPGSGHVIFPQPSQQPGGWCVFASLTSTTMENEEYVQQAECTGTVFLYSP